MPVFSYIVYPVRGRKDDLVWELSELPHCEIIPSENEDLVILVTDTPDREAEDFLQAKLKGLENIQCLSMAYGHVGEDELAQETE